MNCAQAAKSAVPSDTHAAFVRALLFGGGAAVLGLILYSTFGIVTGLLIGYLSLGVGYIVGKAMIKGSRGIGGRRYQIAAVLYTYAAVSMSAIPIGVAYEIKHRPPEQAQRATAGAQASPEQRVQSAAEADQQLQQEFGSGAARPLPRTGTHQGSAGTGSAGTPASPNVAGVGGNAGRAAQGKASSGVRPSANFWGALGYLVFMGLASPFLELQDPIQGFIGLIILMVGIRIAWRLTEAKQAEVLGPFENAARV